MGPVAALGPRGGLIVILDEFTESHYHSPDCESIAQPHFEEKRSNAWKTGAYYWIESAAQAAGYAVACDNCGGRVSEART